jgi:hypothetical protein
MLPPLQQQMPMQMHLQQQVKTTATRALVLQ